MTQFVQKAQLHSRQQSKLQPHIKGYLHISVALMMGLAILFGLNPTHGLTAEGVSLLAIVIPTIYMWLFVNTHWVSLLFLALLIKTGIMTPNQVWAGSLGHFAIMLVLTFSILSESLNETGTIQKIANWFITRKFVQGRPYAFMAMFFASNIVIGIFMQNLALAVMYIALTAQICENIGIKKGDTLYNCFMMGVFWGNGVLSIASPIAKSLPNILIGLVYTSFGIEITYAQWFMFGMPFAFISFLLIMLCIRLINPNTDVLKNFDIEAVKEKEKPLSLRGIFTLMGMMALILIILLPEIFLFFNVFVEFSSFLIRMGPTVPAILIIVTLSLIHVSENDRPTPVLDFSQMAKKVPINLLLFVSAVVIMGTPLAAESSGVIPWMQAILAPMTNVLPPYLLFAALIIIAVIVTNFISNTVVVTIFVSLGAAILVDHPIGPVVFAIVAAFASCMAFITPSSTLTAPLYYGPEHATVKGVLGMNIMFLLMATLLIIAMTPLVVLVMGG